MPPASLNHERGCGRRTAGGLYLVTPTSPYGRPIEDFLICPPILPTFDLPTQGQMPFWKDNALHLVDWIGECFYPNVCDWIEEARVLGISSKVSLQFATSSAGGEAGVSILEALTPWSRLWFAHPRAHIANIYPDYVPVEWSCPKNRHLPSDWDDEWNQPPQGSSLCCVGAYWWDLDGGDPVEVPAGIDLTVPDRLVSRTLPCNARYMGRTRPEGVTPDYRPAIFARFPIVQLELVRGESGEHLPVRERLEGLNLNIPVLEMDE